jgi:RND family efflux transporter MFP subunit
VIGVVARMSRASSLRHWTDAQNIPTVDVVQPLVGDGKVPLDLPGSMDAYTNAPIYARTNGYLKSWSKDIGAQVKSGEVLGVIDVPDIDQEQQQAKADLASAKANAALAGITAKRWQSLQSVDPDSVAKQAVDERNGAYEAQQAQTIAAQANLERLRTLTAFATLVAPFDGRVTARNTDVGQLVNAGQSGVPLFVVSDTSKLRVYVRVPQVYAPAIHAGDEASLTVPEYPNQVFKAHVIADARAINPTSGTTLVQLLVDNQDGRLLPSSYASVHFQLSEHALGMQVPAEALVFDDRGLRVATLDASGQVRFKTVTIRRDYGKTVELGSGLVPSDQVILNPPDGLVDGDKVHISDKASASVGPHAKA